MVGAEDTKAGEESLALNRDNNRLAHSASNEAKRANKIAIFALAVALVSLGMSALGMIHSWK
jgi:hypothetical protein